MTPIEIRPHFQPNAKPTVTGKPNTQLHTHTTTMPLSPSSATPPAPKPAASAPPTRAQLMAAAATKEKPPVQTELLPAATSAPVEVLAAGEGPEGATLEIMQRGNVHGIEKFTPLEVRIKAAKEAALALTILPDDSPEEKTRKMAEAERMRKEVFRASRLAAGKLHKELKEGITKTGRALDAAERGIRLECEEMELHLEQIEEYAQRERDRLEQEQREARAAELSPFLTGPVAVDLGKIDEETYQNLLRDSRDLHEMRERKRLAEEQAEKDRLEAERAEQERVRKEQEERAEQERAEAEERQRKLQEERDRLAAALREQKERADNRRALLGDLLPYLTGCDLGTASDEEFEAATAAATERRDAAKAAQVKEAIRNIRRGQVQKLNLSRYLPDTLIDLADPTDDEWDAIVKTATEEAEEEDRKQRQREEADRKRQAEAAELARQRRELEEKQERERKEQERKQREEQERLARIAAAGDSALIEEYAKALDAVALPKLKNEAMELNIRGQMVRVVAWINQKAADMKEGAGK